MFTNKIHKRHIHICIIGIRHGKEVSVILNLIESIKEGVIHMSKVLVTYFSASGVTAKTANKLAKEVDGDVFEIEPKEKYTSADLNWMDKKSRSSVEMNDPASRPEIAKQVENMDMYDTVLVGFPIWWYVEPKIIDTFLDSYDFSGKTVIPFATSGGSGIENVEKNLQKEYPNINWGKGKLLNGSVKAWF